MDVNASKVPCDGMADHDDTTDEDETKISLHDSVDAPDIEDDNDVQWPLE